MAPNACSAGGLHALPSPTLGWPGAECDFHSVPHFKVEASDVGDLTKDRQEAGIRAQVSRCKIHNHNRSRLPGWPAGSEL